MVWLRFKKFVLYFVVVVVFVSAVDLALLFGVGHYHPKLPDRVDAVVVLGAAIYSPTLYYRTLTAVDLINAHKSDVVVLSGGKKLDSDISEAQYMKKIIGLHSDVKPRLILEDQSHTTYENIQNVRRLIPDARSIILVSDEFHIARAVLLAKRAGFNDVYWSSPDPGHFDRDNLEFYYFREFFALLWYVPKLVFSS